MIPGKEEREEVFAFMNGYVEMAVDLPDSAWQAVGEDAVRAYNELNDTKYDPYETWLRWAMAQERQPASTGGHKP